MSIHMTMWLPISWKTQKSNNPPSFQHPLTGISLPKDLSSFPPESWLILQNHGLNIISAHDQSTSTNKQVLNSPSRIVRSSSASQWTSQTQTNPINQDLPPAKCALTINIFLVTCAVSLIHGNNVLGLDLCPNTIQLYMKVELKPPCQQLKDED